MQILIAFGFVPNIELYYLYFVGIGNAWHLLNLELISV